MPWMRCSKWTVMLSFFTAALLLVSACTVGGTSKEPAKATGDPNTAKGDLSIEIDAGHNEVPLKEEQSALQKLGLNYKLVGLPFVGQYEKIVTEMVADNGAFDVLIFPPYMIGDFVSKGFLLPLDKYAKQLDPGLKDVLAPFREPTLTVNGSLYALPYDGDWHMLYYRSDLFDNPKNQSAFESQYGYALGPPKTWKEYLDIAQFFTRPPNLYGTAFYGQRGFSYAWWADIWAGLGGRWFDSDMNPLINSPAGVKALKLLIEQKKYSPPDVLSYGYEELRDVFLRAKVAMIIQWGDVGKKANDPSVSDIRGKVGFSTVPNGRTYMPYSRVMAVGAGSDNPAAAYRVMQYITKPGISDQYVADPATGEDIFRYSQLKPQLYKTVPASQRKSYIAAAKANLEQGFPELNIPGAPRYLDSLDQEINKALSGQVGPKAALDAAAVEWKKITESQGVGKEKRYYQQFVQAFKSAGLKY